MELVAVDYYILLCLYLSTFYFGDRWKCLHSSWEYHVHVRGDGVRLSLNCGHQRAPCLFVSMDSHGGMILTRENRRTRRKPDQMPLCPPQVPRGLTRASAARGQRLTA
jgi:hypothetical protein